MHLPTEKLALRELEKLIVPINRPDYRPKRIITFSEFVSLWQKTVLTQKRESYQDTVRSVIRQKLIPFFGDYQLHEIDTETIQRFVASLEGKPRTIRNAYTYLRSTLRSAKKWKYITTNPAEGVELPRMEGDEGRRFTLEEARAIIHEAEEPAKTMFWTAAETALRAGEILGLTIDDVDLLNLTIRVRQKIYKGRIEKLKSVHSERSFEISPELASHLAHFLQHHWKRNDLKLLFPSKKGTPLHYTNVLHRKIYPLLSKLGIEKAGLHSFRHFSATELAREGIPEKVISQRLGHGSTQVTKRYIHAVSEDGKRAAAYLGQLLRPSAPKSEIPDEHPAKESQIVQ